MSVKELKFKTEQGHLVKVTNKLNSYEEFEFEVFDDDTIWFWLNRSQAHLLMLWLQEHLK